jgi:Glutathione-dependent formaldehyde-activating enzyme
VRLTRLPWGIATAAIAKRRQAAHLLRQFLSPLCLNITGEVKYHEVTGDSGRIVRRGFCPNCGVRLFGKATASPEIISIMAGSLELVSAASGHLYSERAVLGLYESGSAQVPRLAPELVRGSPDFGGENFFRLATFD